MIRHAFVLLVGVLVGAVLAYFTTPKQELHSSIVHIDYLRSVEDLDGSKISLLTDSKGNRSVNLTSPSIQLLQRETTTIGVNNRNGYIKQNHFDSLPDWINTRLTCSPIRSETRMDVQFQIKWDVYQHAIQPGEENARVIRLPLAPTTRGEKYFAVIYPGRIR